MKTKTQFTNRILSLVLALVMALGILPMTAFAATEVNDLVYNYDSLIEYTDGTTQYVKQNNYLYKVTYTNLRPETFTNVALSRSSYNYVQLFLTTSRYINLYKNHDSGAIVETSDLPKSEGISLSCYDFYGYDNAVNQEQPIVIITCIAVNEPTWSWTGTSSATATFTAKDADVFATAEASISSETISAAINCQTKEQIQYTATVTFNGQKYTDTKTVYGDAGPHSYTYSSLGNTITETCNNCSNHTATATLEADGAYIYTGSAITPATITYSDNWQGDKPTDISYSNNLNVGTATATITVEGRTLTKNFQIKNVYSVSFNANGGSGEKNSVPIADGEEYTLPANPFTAPSGYQFKGWAASQNGNVLEGEKIIVSENVTLYAIWEKIPAEMPTVAVSENLTLTYSEYTGQKFTATVEKKDGYTYEYQWIDGNTVISNTDTLEIPDDLAAGVYDYYLGVGAKRTDNGEITWYTNRNLFVKVNPKELDASNVTLSQDAFTYDGNEQKPTVTVNVGSKTLTENSDYTVTWPSDCKNADTKTITVTFKGNYSGTAQVDYKIKQKEIGIYWSATEFIPYTGELIVPQATAIGLANGDVCTLMTSVVDTTEGAGIIPGRWHAKVTSLSNDNYCLPASGNLVEVEYGIVKGYIAVPVVSGIDETIKGKADGKINGLTTEMEYATEYTADDDKYTKVTDANMTFAPGTYYVRYQAAGYYNASSFTEVVIKEGGLLSVSTPQTQTGYTIVTADTELVWNGSTTLSFTLKDGYSKTDAFAVKVNGTPVALDANDQYVITNAQANIEITVEGVADITPPAAEIKVKQNSWTSFWNNLTFGLFFKETQDVTITASDIGSGVKSIQYYLSNGELELDEVKAITDWVDYNGTFKIDPNNRYVVYAKVTDNTGNTLYINSDGIVLDNIAPTLEGIENGKTYYGDLTVIKSDEQFYDIKVVTLDGEPMGFAEGTYGLIPADNEEHIVVVEDHAGNKTAYTVTVMKNYTVTYKADGEPISTETVGHGKDANLPSVPAKNGYVGKWDSDGKNITGDTTITVVYTEIPVVKPNEVKPEDKTDLEDTKKQLEDMLKDDSYTDENKKNIQDAIDDIDDALEVIGNVEAVEKVISKLPAVDTVKPDDEEAIKAISDAQTAYNALSDYEKSLVDEAAKANLDKLVAALVAYDIVEGDGSSWTEDSDHNITFVVNGLFSKFVGIKVDGKDVDKANYEVKEGSTIITLKASYLDTLAVGEHTITVVYTDSSTDGTFNVHAKTNSPATGDNSNMFLWIALLFISGGAVITLTVVDRKRRMASNR